MTINRPDFKFPIGGSLITAGELFLDKNILITGHENGVVIEWNLETGKSKVLYTCSSQVQTINSSNKREVIVGSYGGHLVLINQKGQYFVIQLPTYTVQNSIWKSHWPNDDSFIISSTYGALILFERQSDNSWVSKSLYGHSNNVFGIGSSPKGLLATGDETGRILIWKKEAGEYKVSVNLLVSGSVKDIVFLGDDTLLVLGAYGQISEFQYNKDRDTWTLISEVRNASGKGNCIHVLKDSKTILAGTNDETIQYETETQLAKTIKITRVKRIFSTNNEASLLTAYGLKGYKIWPIEPKDLIKYKYVKIGIVGHTGVGKSTLCNCITSNSPGDVKSTFGKKVWNWEFNDDKGLRKLVILQDYGGQETVLSTFLPFIADSDILLILFQQNDITTFDKALAIYDIIQKNTSSNLKVFFVQTHVDQKVIEFDENIIDNLIQKGKVIANLKVCPKNMQGIDELKEKLLEQVSWNQARTMIQSSSSNAVFEIILDLQEKNTAAISVENFASLLEKKIGHQIEINHLKFLLSDYSNQGMLEYNPKIDDNEIIFNEPDYNRLKTEIPIFAMKRNGIVSYKQLENQFENHKFLPLIDAIYLKYKIAIENNGRRIFPELLSKKAIQITDDYLNFLNNASENIRYFTDGRLDIAILISALSDLKLQCVDASKSDGLFTWEDNALVYYCFERIGNRFDGFKSKCTFRIGGKNQRTIDRLNSEFITLLDRLFGPFLEISNNENIKKKVDGKRNIIYDVAISYASEQGEYASSIAETLRAKGIVVFFDQFFESKLWGKDLAEYLMDVYYKQASFCIMLISKDYVSKAWPTHERRSAVARNITDLGEYILPVRFDDSEIPGLPPTIKYINANKKKADEVSSLFLQKLKDERIDVLLPKSN